MFSVGIIYLASYAILITGVATTIAVARQSCNSGDKI